MKSICQFLNEYHNKRTKCEIWTRCMGYYRNIRSFNVGKRSEFKQRVFYKVKPQQK